jgi:hypothetical protein
MEKLKKEIIILSIPLIISAFLSLGLAYLLFFFKDSLMQGVLLNAALDPATGSREIIGPKLFWIVGSVFLILGFLNFLIFYGFIKGFKWAERMNFIEFAALDILSLSLMSAFMLAKRYQFFKRSDVQQYFSKKGYGTLVIGLIIVVMLGLFFISAMNPTL